MIMELVASLGDYLGFCVKCLRGRKDTSVMLKEVMSLAICSFHPFELHR